MKQSFPGISPLAKDITQKYLKTHQEFQVQNTSLKLTCVILVVVVVFNTMFSALLVYKNALMAEENLQLIQENQALMGFHQLVNQMFASEPINGDSEKFARMVDTRLTPREDCPPCTTEKPTIVQPHKNPVSILNELTSHASYDCDHQCLNPPIHLSTLTVTDPDLPESTFTGKGDSKQRSKQVAAYRALEALFPEHLDEVGDDLMPDLDFNPICLDPKLIMVHPSRKKC
ncbi:uncharacterized protein LOC110847545 [Folsomia candida]|uniref:DRBM domain-containing protein n=1 Tax=Folsomia candida TaxID=158441 RepID=A0A226EIK5_FOLCA|nr:uncharacterized protein LOC110847545 [Folsomia candida]OXA56947.1 hypothetical protein Fcan01_07149 [Folsomia candida]